MSAKFSIRLLLIVMLVCGISSVVQSQDRIVLELWVNDDELGQCLSDLYTSGFNSHSETSQVRVTLQAEAYTIIGTALSGGGGPDVVPTDGPLGGLEMGRAGLLLPLDAYVEQHNLDEQFVPWALDIGRTGGSLYILPDSNEFDWFPIPSSDGQEQFMTGLGAAWGINANSSHPDEAAELLAWMFSPEVQAQRLLECNFALAPIEISSDAFSGTDPRIAAVYSRYGDAAARGNYGYVTWTFFPPLMQSTLYEQIQRVYLGELTPEAYLEALQAAFDQDVARGNVPPIPPR